MYATYAYQAGSTTTNVVSDIVKLLTGETNKANLSADCVQGGTSIISTVAAGWTVHDASAGTDAQVVKALNADGSTYKYLYVHAFNSTIFEFQTFESWNAGTHTGTNGVYIGDTQPAWTAATGGSIYIYATPRNAFIRFYSGGWKRIAWCFEHTRDTVASSYPCHAMGWPTSDTSTFSDVGSPRVKWNTTGDLGAGSSPANAVISGMGLYNNSGTSAIGWYRHSDETLRIVAYRPYVYRAGQTYANTGWAALGSLYDVYCTGYDVGATLDEVSYGGKMYVLHQGSSGQPTFMIPKE